MRKVYVLDTSVLVYDPSSFRNYHGHDVVIPVHVLDELDKLKSQSSEAGKNARVCVRTLDELCKKGDIHKGIKIENNIHLKIDTANNPDKFGPASYIDNKILSCAYSYTLKSRNRKGHNNTILVSRDINLRVRARAFDIAAEDYTKDKPSLDVIYKGYRDVVSNELGKKLNDKSTLDCNIYDEIADLAPHECVHFLSETGDGLSLGRRVGDKVHIIKNKKAWGVESKNKEQAMAMDMLMDHKLPLVNLIGAAGCGKSLLAMAAGLEQVLDQKRYEKICVFRPVNDVGENSIGFLPGTALEKLSVMYKSCEDTLEFLFKKNERWKTTVEMYMEKGIIEYSPIAHVRGRSIANAFIIIDEFQNCDDLTARTLLTRAAASSKIVCTGDIMQIDHKKLDFNNNALSLVVDKFKNSHLAGSLVMEKSLRSPLAEEACGILYGNG